MTTTAGPPANPSPRPSTAVIDVARQVATVVSDASPEERADTIAAAAWRHQLNRHTLAALVDQHLTPPTQEPATNHGAPNK